MSLVARILSAQAAKSKVQKAFDGGIPGLFRLYYKSKLFDRLAKSCILHFLAHFEHDALSKVSSLPSSVLASLLTPMHQVNFLRKGQECTGLRVSACLSGSLQGKKAAFSWDGYPDGGVTAGRAPEGVPDSPGSHVPCLCIHFASSCKFQTTPPGQPLFRSFV